MGIKFIKGIVEDFCISFSKTLYPLKENAHVQPCTSSRGKQLIYVCESMKEPLSTHFTSSDIKRISPKSMSNFTCQVETLQSTHQSQARSVLSVYAIV